MNPRLKLNRGLASAVGRRHNVGVNKASNLSRILLIASVLLVGGCQIIPEVFGRKAGDSPRTDVIGSRVDQIIHGGPAPASDTAAAVRRIERVESDLFSLKYTTWGVLAAVGAVFFKGKQ